MALRTVRVPAGMETLFADAERIVSMYFREKRNDPEHGTIEIFGERYILVRAASLSVEFFALVRDLYGRGREAEADSFAKNILFDLAHAIGKSDANNFHSKMGLVDPIARLSAGPVHFAHAGWAFVDIFGESKPAPDESFYLLYDHPYSFESDAWLRAGQARDFAVCIMNAGYSSGWCEESFGVKLVATELHCRAKGDATCRFLMAHPDRVEGHVQRYFAEHAERGGGDASPPSYEIPDFFARKRVDEELAVARSELERRVFERTAELRASHELLTHEMAERKQAERRLLQAHKLEAVGTLAGGIAHDFNNLIAIVLGNAGLLETRMRPDDPLRPFVLEITAAGQRAATLTQQLLAFSRAQVLTREVLDVNATVTDLGRMLERVLTEEIQLVITLGHDAGAVEADRGQLEQVLMNLAVNARDAMPSGGTLTIETSRATLDEARQTDLGVIEPGTYVLLRVTDTGTGMDEETLSHVFDPFFTTKATGKGSGLGLSTVYGIVKQQKGGVMIGSAPGKGSTFCVYLPQASAEAVRAAPCASEADAIDVPQGTETVLVVEDQRPLRAVIAEALRGLGYTVLVAADAREALRVDDAYQGEIHLLLTDVVMPRMRGPELAARLRARRPATKVIFMSGFTDEEVLGRTNGESIALLAKPFLPDALGKKVRDVLDAR